MSEPEETAPAGATPGDPIADAFLSTYEIRTIGTFLGTGPGKAGAEARSFKLNESLKPGLIALVDEFHDKVAGLLKGPFRAFFAAEGLSYDKGDLRSVIELTTFPGAAVPDATGSTPEAAEAG